MINTNDIHFNDLNNHTWRNFEKNETEAVFLFALFLVVLWFFLLLAVNV